MPTSIYFRQKITPAWSSNYYMPYLKGGSVSRIIRGLQAVISNAASISPMSLKNIFNSSKTCLPRTLAYHMLKNGKPLKVYIITNPMHKDLVHYGNIIVHLTRLRFHHAGREFLDHNVIMCCHYHCGPIVSSNVDKQVHDLVWSFGIKISRRLVS